MDAEEERDYCLPKGPECLWETNDTARTFVGGFGMNSISAGASVSNGRYQHNALPFEPLRTRPVIRKRSCGDA